MTKATAGRDQAPADHDARDPASRAEAVEREIARHLAQRVGQEEQTRGKAELRVGDPEIGVHGERGDADRGAVEIIEEIGDGEQRQEAPRGLPERAPLQRRCSESARCRAATAASYAVRLMPPLAAL